ncbi:hypothetical protein ACJMK2_021709 [Sinanodonta woodiana]|uniref:Profilin n=1 Tax=Sinanodonta woodiana TaxID=1069815 RepID=A0ABD3TGW0_SINWO
MSWKDYVENQLLIPGDMSGAGIFGLDGNKWSVMGKVVDEITPQEMERLVKIIQGVDKEFSGIKLGGKSYLYCKHDETDRCILVSRILPSDSKEEKFFCCGYLANQCIAFGVIVGNHKLGNCSLVCSRLRDYFKQVGY